MNTNTANPFISLFCLSLVCLVWPGLWAFVAFQVGRRSWIWPAFVARLWRPKD